METFKGYILNWRASLTAMLMAQTTIVFSRRLVCFAFLLSFLLPTVGKAETNSQFTVVVEGLLIQNLDPTADKEKLKNRVVIKGCANENLSLDYTGNIDQFSGVIYATMTPTQIKQIGATGCSKGRYTLDTSAYDDSMLYSRTNSINLRKIFPIVNFTCVSSTEDLSNKDAPSC